MTVKQLYDFVDLLHKKTMANEVEWSETPAGNQFQVTFTNYSIQIAEEINNDRDYFISIYNEDGNKIESISDFELDRENVMDKRYYKIMQEIYENARRKALRADEALRNIMDYLSKG